MATKKATSAKRADAESIQKRPNAARAAPAMRGKSAQRKADTEPRDAASGARGKGKAPGRSGSAAREPSARQAGTVKKAANPATEKGRGERKPKPDIAPGEQGPRKIAKPVKDQGDKIEEPPRSKPMSMRDLLEARQRRAKQGPSWPDADPHNHRAAEKLDLPPGDEARIAEKAAERKNMDPTERDRRSKHEPRGPR